MVVAPGASVEELREALTQVSAGSTDAARIEQIAELERVKSVATAVQARVTAAFAESQRAQLAAAGCSTVEAGRSIGSQIALARRDSPTRGSRFLGFAEALCSDMPGTLEALARGETSEWRATLVVRETAVLTREHRRAVDAELAARLPELGDTQAEREARRIGMRLDPDSATRRARRAVQSRRVTIRPAPDSMATLSATVPVVDGVAAFAALTRHADLHPGNGDGRSRSQIIADTLIDRLLCRTPVPGTADTGADADRKTEAGTGAGTGAGTTDPASTSPPETDAAETDAPAANAADSDAGEPAAADPAASGRGVSVEVQLIITDHTLLDGGSEPAEIPSHGPVPASLARQLIADTIDAAAADGQAGAFVRRLFTDPTGKLIATESRRRTFPPGMARFIRTRDANTCRTPWCNAPIRHLDHITPAETGGPTSITNSEGLCERCNYTKQILGWTSTAERGGGTVEITTPTGQTYQSRPPPLPGVA